MARSIHFRVPRPLIHSLPLDVAGFHSERLTLWEDCLAIGHMPLGGMDSKMWPSTLGRPSGRINPIPPRPIMQVAHEH